MLDNTLSASETRPDEGFGFSMRPQDGSNQFGSILAAARRQIWVVFVVALVFLALGIGFLIQAVPRYTSSVSILIDAKKVGMTATSALEGSLTFETGAVDSQVQILMSDKIATTVATRLGLQNNISFLDPQPSPLGWVFATAFKKVKSRIDKALGKDPSPAIADLPEPVRLLLAVDQLKRDLKVSRVNRTYVLAVEFTDEDPALAMAITGQYADVYLEDQLDSKFDATRRASVWMDDRIRDLKAKALAADEAVQTFRAKNNLTQASGRLINEQALTDASTQLSMAQGELNTARAKYERLKDIVDSKDVSGSMTDSLGNPLISQFRAKYLQASKLDSEITAKYGADHQSAVNARKDMAQYQRLIFDELTRMLQSYQSDVEITRDKVTTLERSIQQMKTTNTTDNESLVKLRSLEQEAQTLNTLYTSFLQKFQETQQQQSFPVTDARVISQPSTPLLPSSPKTLLVLAASFALGCVFGAGLGALREFRDRGFRTGAQIREELGLEFIANIPALPKSEFKLRKLPKSGTSRHLVCTHSALDYVTKDPFSRFAESVRAVKIAIDHAFADRGCAVVGLVSMYPEEGKSTLSKNLATLAAAQGMRVLLIDGDLRHPKLTRDLAQNGEGGLLDIVTRNGDLEATLMTEESSGLHFLPGARHKRIPIASNLLGHERMVRLIERLRSDYDLIVIDLPPVGVVTDALAALRYMDGYIFTTEWGKTPRHVVRELLIDEAELADKIIGVVLNKVNIKKLRLYNAYSAYSYKGQYESRYYGSAS